VLRAPDGIWVGADRALWLADTGANAIVRLDPLASDPDAMWVTYGEPPIVAGSFDIKPGADPADGFLWFTNKAGNSIGRMFTGSI